MSGTNYLFWVHLSFFVLLVLIAKLRGRIIQKKYLSVFPSVALIFDLVPLLNIIPFVPSILHLFTLSRGIWSTKNIKTFAKLK